jgi:hypothetical protein
MSFSSFKNFAYQVSIQKLFNKLIPPNGFIENESFELPIINNSKYYKGMNESQKEKFKWVAGGNAVATDAGPAISDNGTGFGFPTFITGEQALAMQSTSFIQQDIYLNIGTYFFSTYFISKNGEYNPIQVSIKNGEIITTIDQVASTWTLFTHTFNILKAGNKTLRLEGTLEGNVTTGIDLVALSFKAFPYIPIPNDKMISNTRTQKGVEDYVATQSSVGNDFTGGVGNLAFEALDGKSNTFWHCQYINRNSPYTTQPYDNGIYQGGGSLQTTFKTIVSGESVFGEWLQIKLPSPIILKSFEYKSRNEVSERNPKKFTIAGSNDGDIWENILTTTLQTNPQITLIKILTSSNTTTYSYYRLIIEQLFGNVVDNLAQFNLYGYEEGKINTNFDNLLANISNKTPYAYFRATDYDIDTKEIPAKIGNFTATTSGVTYGNGSGNGAGTSIPFLIGAATSKINFTADIPNTFTVCSITRYTGNTGRRILCAQSSNWLHGHWNNKIGVAHYNYWINESSLNNTLFNDWIVTCGKNGSQPTTNLIANGINKGEQKGGDGGYNNICINNGPFGETSDFAFSQLLIWNQILTDDEMKKVSDYLMQYLVDGLY